MSPARWSIVRSARSAPRPVDAGIAACLAALTLALGACASPQPPVRWVKDGASEEDLERVRAACTKRALAVQEPSRSYSSTARGAEFIRCMRERGWRQVREEPFDEEPADAEPAED